MTCRIRTGDWKDKTMNLEGKRVLVVGSGKSGVAAAELLRKKGITFVLFDGNKDLDVTALIEKNPVFCEVYFDEQTIDMNLMMELNGHWFYKAPGVKCIDMMSAFFKKPLESEADMSLKIFAPPASGENDPSQGEDWMTNYYAELKALPEVRIRFAPIVK